MNKKIICSILLGSSLIINTAALAETSINSNGVISIDKENYAKLIENQDINSLILKLDNFKKNYPSATEN